ncbi:MAG: YwaF family protein [Clostridia bacterium]|nr:YwaF family protein [Clostridia bacterium]
MTIIEKIHNFLDYEIETPSSYGAFHIVSLVLIVAFTVFLCKAFKNSDEKSERRIAFWCWIVVVVLEIYKQLNFSISFEEGVFVWDYSWYSFPFQFCSSPIYVLPLVAFLPSGKVREALVAFLGTFSLFAGLAVCIYPNDVYISTLGIDIQTTVHHGLQVVLGIFFALRRFDCENPPKKKSYLLGAISVFAVFAGTAMLLNIVGYHALTALGIDETFNMFYISPYFECTLPVLSIVDDFLPYPIFLAVYIFGFGLVAFIMMTLVNSVIFAVRKIITKTKLNGNKYA